MNLNCKDQLIELIKAKGFNLVLNPRENIQPLQVLSRQQSGVWAWVKDVFTTPVLDDANAGIDELLIADEALPPVKAGTLASGIKATRSSDVGVDAGVELMLNFLKLPISEQTEDLKLKIEASLKSIEKINFAVGGNAKMHSVSHIALDSFLHGASIRETVGNQFREMLDNNQLFIVTDVLTSNSFSMNGIDKTNGLVDINLPDIQDLFKGKVSGKFENAGESGLEYEGEQELVFGLKAVKLLTQKSDKGKYSFKIKIEDGMAVRGEADYPVDLLATDDNFLGI